MRLSPPTGQLRTSAALVPLRVGCGRRWPYSIRPDGATIGYPGSLFVRVLKLEALADHMPGPQSRAKQDQGYSPALAISEARDRLPPGGTAQS